MWFDELEIAIIEKDSQKIGDLINSLPYFNKVDETLAQGLHLDGQFRIKVTQKNANEYGNENLHIQNFQVLHG